MNRKLLLPLSVIVIAAVAGCASDDTSRDDGLTPEEVAAGDAWASSGASEHADDDENDPGHETSLDPAAVDAIDDVTTPAEDSAPFLEPEDTLAVPDERIAPTQIDLEDLESIKACHKATAYRRGKASTICITQVDGKWVEVNTAKKFLTMRTAARRAGVTIKVVSGFRTMAQQRYFYSCYKTKKCNGGNLAAPPGYSNHQSGTALDLNTTAGKGVYTWLTKYAKGYGFRRTVPSEKWHWER